MNSRRLWLLSSVAVILVPVGAAKCEAGWLSPRECHFLPFRHHHSCEPTCQPSCIPVNPCECASLLLLPPCVPPSLAVAPAANTASPVGGSIGAWYMSPTGHATSFLDTPWGGAGFRAPIQPSSVLPPLYVSPPGGGFNYPGDTPPSGGYQLPPFGGPPGGPRGGPPVQPPGVEVRPVPPPPALVLISLGTVGLIAFRRRLFAVRV
jgi:hypothetical protein